MSVNEVTADIRFATYSKAAWDATIVPLPAGSVAYVSDQYNAKKVGNGIDLFSALPYHGTTTIVANHTGTNSTTVFPKTFVFVEPDTCTVRYADGASAYSALPYVQMQTNTADIDTGLSAPTTGELAAIRDIMSNISMVSAGLKTRATVSATDVSSAFTAQSLDATDYAILSESSDNTHTIDQVQLLLLMVKDINDRLTVLEAALL